MRSAPPSGGGTDSERDAVLGAAEGEKALGVFSEIGGEVDDVVEVVLGEGVVEVDGVEFLEADDGETDTFLVEVFAGGDGVGGCGGCGGHGALLGELREGTVVIEDFVMGVLGVVAGDEVVKGEGGLEGDEAEVAVNVREGGRQVLEVVACVFVDLEGRQEFGVPGVVEGDDAVEGGVDGAALEVEGGGKGFLAELLDDHVVDLVVGEGDVAGGADFALDEKGDLLVLYGVVFLSDFGGEGLVAVAGKAELGGHGGLLLGDVVGVVSVNVEEVDEDVAVAVVGFAETAQTFALEGVEVVEDPGPAFGCGVLAVLGVAGFEPVGELGDAFVA
jgi:hypothetical protein